MPGRVCTSGSFPSREKFEWKIGQSGEAEAVELYNCRNLSAPLVKFYATWIDQTFIPVQGLSNVKNSLFSLCCVCHCLQVPQQVNAKSRAAPGAEDSKIEDISVNWQHHSWNSSSDHRQTTIIHWATQRGGPFTAGKCSQRLRTSSDLYVSL